MRASGRGAGPVVSAVVVMMLAACGRGGDSGGAGGAGGTTVAVAAGDSGRRTACPGDNAGLTLPAGFCATIFADSIGDARDLVVSASGDVYVTLEGTQPSPEKAVAGNRQPAPASFVALRDVSNDGKADTVVRVGKLGNTGIGLFGGYLYVDEGTRIVRYGVRPGELAPSGAAEVVVSGMPLPGHRARSFAITPAGTIYVVVGSATNSCQTKDRETASPGIDPCKELDTRAGIWKYDANKTGQTFSPAARYATGIRNGMGIALDPTGQLWATQHGRDQLHDNWPNVFASVHYQAENPAEELLQVEEGDDFGWPYCYWSVDEKHLVDAPEYGGDGKKTARCASKKEPVATFPGHWAPMSVLFYTGTMLPAKYRSGAFIAFHGSWNRAPDPQAGYRVVFQPLTANQSSGAYETFADGFAGLPPDQIQPDRAKHRPVGLAQGPDGALFISDDAGGRIYRVTYTGR
jgi:glucose/arabinose dehydrogenase